MSSVREHLPARGDKILVSSCLIGKKCSYDGNYRENKLVEEFISGRGVIDVCPEMLAGLPSPRPRCEIKNGDGKDVLKGKAKVINEKGEDVTSFFLEGAKQTLNIVWKHNIKYAILKARSPSCGSKKIYDGSFTGKLKNGDGVTAAMLKLNGVIVYDEEELEKIVKRKGDVDAFIQ
jgi:uncharacterized protein YbbK (DUF523 family)